MLFLKVLGGIILGQIAIFAYILSNRVLLPYTPYGKLNVAMIVFVVLLIASFISTVATALGYIINKYIFYKENGWPKSGIYTTILVLGTVILCAIWLFLIFGNNTL